MSGRRTGGTYRGLLGLVLFAGCVAGCRSAPPAPVAMPATATPTPPPSLGAGDPSRLLPDGRVEYHLVVRSESGTAYVPLALVSSSNGEGRSAWTRPTAFPWAWEEASDTFVPRAANAGGAVQEELFNVIFPAAPQELKVAVKYAGGPPASETVTLRYYAVEIGDIASKAYVFPAIGDAEAARTSRETRSPLGTRLRSVEVFRWLAGGFFLRDPGPVREASITIAGVQSEAANGKGP